MPPSLSVQLYSLGRLPGNDPWGVVARLSELGFAGVEPVLQTGSSDAMAEWVASQGFEQPTIDAAALKAALDEHDMVAHACHVQLPEGDHAEQILDEQEMLGSKIAVVPALFDAATASLEPFDDRDRILRWAERFAAAADRARQRGIRIGYHNHAWEFRTDFDGRTGYEVFFDHLPEDVVAEVDAYWATVGGVDPVDLIDRLGSRAALIHIKDGGSEPGSPSCALGEGVVDIEGVRKASADADWHVVEIEQVDEAEIWPLLEQYVETLTNDDE